MDPQVQVALIGIAASVITALLGQVAGYLLILRYIIRRQVDGNWVLRVDHDKALADKDAQIAAEREVSKEWKGAFDEESKAGRIKDDSLNKSINANKMADGFYSAMMAKTPLVGDNVAGEGVPR